MLPAGLEWYDKCALQRQKGGSLEALNGESEKPGLDQNILTWNLAVQIVALSLASSTDWHHWDLMEM